MNGDDVGRIVREVVGLTRRRSGLLLVLALVLTGLVSTAAAAQGGEEIKWISVLREVGGWGIAALALVFLNRFVEENRRDRDEREKHAAERERLFVAALADSARVGERVTGAVTSLADFIKDRRETLDRALERLGEALQDLAERGADDRRRILTELGLARHDTANLLQAQVAQGHKLRDIRDVQGSQNQALGTIKERLERAEDGA